MDTPTKTDLIAKRCVPCEGGVPPLSREECEALIPSVEGWSIDADARRIRRSWTMKNFMAGINFFDKVATLA